MDGEIETSLVRSFASTAAFFVFSHDMMAAIFFSALRAPPLHCIASNNKGKTNSLAG
jgi:hypothetical protein